MSLRTSFLAVLVATMSLAPGGYWGCDDLAGGHGSTVAAVDTDPIVRFASPADGAVVDGLRYGSVEVLAWDPDAGTRNGAGIYAVDMVVTNAATGAYVTGRTEYWATYDFGPDLPAGDYVFTATAHADWFAGGSSSSTSIMISIGAPAAPTAVPATPVPTPTAVPPTPVPPTVVPPTSTPVPPTPAPTATTTPPLPAPPVATPTPLPTIAVPTVAPATPVPATPVPTTPPAPTPTAVPPTPVPATPVPQPPASSASEAAAASLVALNQVRAQVGLPPLTLNASMSTFALDWSKTMAASGFRHSSGPYGENIAWFSDGSISPQAAATFFNDGWVNSPGHYANMTNARYTEVGIGLFQDASGWWATHVFR